MEFPGPPPPIFAPLLLAVCPHDARRRDHAFAMTPSEDLRAVMKCVRKQFLPLGLTRNLRFAVPSQLGATCLGPLSQKAIFSDNLIAHGEATSPDTWTLTVLWVHSLEKTWAKTGIGSTALAVDLQKCPKMSPS